MSQATTQGAGQTFKSWLKSYNPNVPQEIAPFRFNSIAELLLDSCKRNGAKPAFSLMGKTISFAEVERESAAIGAYLAIQGLGKRRARCADDAKHIAVSGLRFSAFFAPGTPSSTSTRFIRRANLNIS